MKNLMILPSLLLLSILSTAYTHRPVYESHSKIDLGKAERVEMSISIFAGELNLFGERQTPLLIGEYLYDDPAYGEPRRRYEVRDRVGYLKIDHGEFEEVDLDDDEECIWNMQLNDKVPADLSINMMAGEGNIMLEGARIDKFNYALKAGAADINLRNTGVKRLKFKAIAGEATIDLSGERNDDLEADLKGGVGNLNLILPKDYNLEIEVSGILGEVNVDGLTKKNGYYVRRTAYNDPTLRIDITGGIGSIYLSVEE